MLYLTKRSFNMKEIRIEICPPPDKALDIACYSRDSKTAFTLAEVLITLGIIGVVAAITIPTILTNVNERVNSTRQANVAYKITQATDKMKSLGLLNGSYKTTDAFVDELQKHLKIAKRCDASHIADCWPTEKVTTADGEEFYVKNAKLGKNLSIKGNTSNNVGLVLADGASIILTYNQNSTGMDVSEATVAQTKTLPVGFGKTEEFAYTSNTTGAIDFVMDVNGKKGPNSETRDNKHKDIRSFKVAKFSKGCAGTEIDGIGCLVDLGTSYECLNNGTDDYKKWDPKGGRYRSCWGGAKKACDNIGMELPNQKEINQIYLKRNDFAEIPKNGRYWSSTEYASIPDKYAINANFGSGPNDKTYMFASDKADVHSAMCVGD